MTTRHQQRVHLSGARETLLFTLYGRAVDYRSPTPLLGDRWAAEVLDRIDGYDRRKVRMSAGDRYTVVLRARMMDAWARDFLARHPDAVVLSLGCGLDSRVFRLDPPAGVRWYDVDFPDVIEIRERLYPAREGCRMIGSSVTDLDWLDEVPTDRPVLVVAEGLLMYLTADDVERLLARVTGRFSHGEMLFDVMGPFVGQFSRLFGYRMWTCGDPRELERMNPRLTLLDVRSTAAEYRHVPHRGYRLMYGLANALPPTRNAIRPLRFRFGAVSP